MADLNATNCSPEAESAFNFTGLSSSSSSAADHSLRRSSSRSIKRKKFDDELVDTSNPFKRMLSSRRSSESSQPDQKQIQPKKVYDNPVAHYA